MELQQETPKLKFFRWFRMTGVDILHPEAPEIKREQNSLDRKLLLPALEEVNKFIAQSIKIS